jgi:hypothetical protein
VLVPEEFFRHGWHLVLEPAEIAVLFALIDRTAHLRSAKPDPLGGVDLKESVRWGAYGISGEAYHSIHSLEQFGLITVRDPMPHGSLSGHSGDGSRNAAVLNQQHVALRLTYDPTAVPSIFSRDALDTVKKALQG